MRIRIVVGDAVLARDHLGTTNGTKILEDKAVSQDRQHDVSLCILYSYTSSGALEEYYQTLDTQSFAKANPFITRLLVQN